MTADQKFRDVYVTEVDGVECSISDSGEFAFIGARCLNVEEARKLRDWLNEALPT